MNDTEGTEPVAGAEAASAPQPQRPVPAPPKHPLTQPIPLTQSTRTRAPRKRRRYRGKMPERAIVFVGPMAAGKTSLGRKVAKDLGVKFIDTDAVFQSQHGLISDFFLEHGEAEFRQLEADIIAEVLSRPGLSVVALGGGAVLTERTREVLRAHPVVLLMTTQAAVLRTANLARRPLLRDDPEAWQRILEERRPLYLEVADVTFRTDRASKEQLSHRVINWARAYARNEAKTQTEAE